MPVHTFTNGDAHQLGTSLTSAVVQASGHGIEVGYTDGDTWFSIPTGQPLAVPDIATHGGSVWVRSTSGSGGVRYVVA